MRKATDTHPCPADCGQEVPHHRYACRADWYRLPREIRDRIWAAHRGQLAGEHSDAMAAARVWYAQHPRTVPHA